MMKRLTWFLGGAAAGIAGAGLAKKKVRTVTAELSPTNLAHKASARVKDAVHEGRRAMKSKEAELRASRDGRLHSMADHVDDGDQVFVDGQPVEPGQVIVLRQVREQRDRPGRRSQG
jgi:hypothetical protein